MIPMAISHLYAQNEQDKIVLDPTEVSFLYNYYEQDGQNAAVTGGRGTEYLKNSAPLINISMPINSKSKLLAVAGIDSYTSASTANIDKYNTGASNSGLNSIAAKDTRKHIDASYSEKITDWFGWSAIGGYSKEYDVTSYNIGGSFHQSTLDGNHKISLATSAYFDNWLLIYPGEIRNPDVMKRYTDNPYHNTGASGNSYNGHTRASYDDDDDHYYPPANPYPPNHNPYPDTHSAQNNTKFDSEMRYTYNVNLAYEFVINRKLNAQVIFDYTYQHGILYTPFHRVYFNDGIINEPQKIVKSEFLPDTRDKIAVGFKLNQYLSPAFVLRAYYRYYQDTFDVTGHTLELELPTRLNRNITFYPFFRYYTQQASKYFAPYAQHLLSAQYYTSDYDLASFSSFSRGVGISISPADGIFKIKTGKNGFFGMKGIQIRYSTYERTNGLEAHNLSFSTDFNFR